ncbi:MAG: sensor histidine kinase, partial [Candidatus Thioglobus sp.]|nr:sensor histidine kinase [Candidatus Thioglobus sp.]
SRLNVMGEMVTEIAHELNQPLTTIATNSFAIANMMKSTNNTDNDKYLDTLNIISAQAEHAASVIRHLRKVSEKEQDEYVGVDINKNIQNSITLINSTLISHNIQLDINLSSHLPDVSIQSVQIDQVVINLCKNAIEAMAGVEKDSRILSIKSAVEDKNIIVSIADTGVGIAKESQLFNAFATSKKGGMGIGLSISRSIIERHGGNLYLEKTSPDGSQFTFSIPIG